MSSSCAGCNRQCETSTSALPGKQWHATTPEDAGWDLEQTGKVNDYLKEMGVTSFMLIQHGLVVEQGGDVAARTELHSCRKSFLSALIGIAANKQIHLGDTLAKLGIDDNPPSLTAEEKRATVRICQSAQEWDIPPGSLRDQRNEGRAAGARQPSAGNVLVLQQLGFQCARWDL